jgi:hypothetical protein
LPSIPTAIKARLAQANRIAFEQSQNHQSTEINVTKIKRTGMRI